MADPSQNSPGCEPCELNNGVPKGLDSESRGSSHDSPSRDPQRQKTKLLDSESRATDRLDSLADKLPQNLRRAFRKFRTQRWHENLDNCHGSCLLRQPEYAAIVAESLLKFDGDRYDLERFVVMPNHVHMLVQMRAGWAMRQQCEPWMRFTGRRINSLRQTTGEFWSEPFDHIVRNEAQFEYLRRYIVENPAKAKLPAGDSLLWIRGLGFVSSHDF